MGLYDNIIKDLKDMGRDAYTFGGTVARGAINQYHDISREAQKKGTKRAVMEAFAKATNNPTVRRAVKGAVAGGVAGSVIPMLGTIPGAIAGGMAGVMGGKNFINANLSPYHLTVDELRKLPPSEIISRVKQGAYERPVTATIDALSLGGGKLLAPTAKGIGESLGIVPTQTEKALFRDITEELGRQKMASSKATKSVSALYTKPMANRVGLTKYITTNHKGNLNPEEIKLGNNIKKALRDAEDIAVNNKWITKKEAMDNTIAQYVMARNAGSNKSLIHNDIIEYINGVGNRNITPNIIKDINKGKNLYNKGKISYLTQAIVNSVDPTGEIKASELVGQPKDYFSTRRIIGRSLAEDMDRHLDDSLQFQLRKVYKAKEAREVTNNLLSQYGRPVKAGETISSNEIVVSPKEIQKVIAKSFTDNNARTLSEYLKSNPHFKEGIAIDKKYIKYIANALQEQRKDIFNTTMNTVKRTLLAQPHWIGLNRVGNFTNNLMEGVDLGDYLEAITKYKRFVPEELRNQTSFSHYLTDEGKYRGLNESFKAGITRMANSISNFNSNDPKKYKKLITGLLEGSNEATTEPLFKIEAGLELLDRYANFVRQAKRYGVANNMSTERVLAKAKRNRSLYNELNNEVNKTLGDYVGRNYSLDPDAYRYISSLVPFYRFLTQTARTTGHQLADRGLAFQSLVGAPDKIGHLENEQLMEALGINDKDFIGGAPYKLIGVDAKGNPNKFRVYGTEALPVGSIAGDLANILSGKPGEGIISPIYNTISEINAGTKNGIPIQTPFKEKLSELGLPYNLIQQVELSPSERWKYIANTLAGYLSSPYRLSTTYIPEVDALIRGEPLKSRYQTDPYTEIPSSYGRQGVVELLGKWLGLQNRTQYIPPKPKVNMRSLMKGQQRYRQKVNQQKGI